MKDLSAFRRAFLLLVPGAFAAVKLAAQTGIEPPLGQEEPGPVRLPNGKKQQDEILKDDYQRNVKDAQELISIARSFEENLEKNDRFVYSLSDMKKLDDIEKLTKRIRGRLKRY